MSIEHNQQVFRFDEEATDEISTEQEESLLKVLIDKISQADAIICSDYLKGVLTRRVLREVAEMGRKLSVPVITAPKDVDPEKYARASVLLPNFREFCCLTRHHQNGDGYEWIGPAALSLIQQHQFDALVVTRGREGLTLFKKASGEFSREDIPAVSQSVFDVTGAGDTALSVFALCIAAGANFSKAGFLANLAAGIAVGKQGTAFVTTEELARRLEDVPLSVSLQASA